MLFAKKGVHAPNTTAWPVMCSLSTVRDSARTLRVTCMLPAHRTLGTRNLEQGYHKIISLPYAERLVLVNHEQIL